MRRPVRIARAAALVAGLILATAATAAPADSTAAPNGDAPLSGVFSDTLIAPVEGRTLCLARRFIFASSFRIDDATRELVAGTDYALDADGGCLVLLDPEIAPPGTRLVARYRALPGFLAPVYRLREDPHHTRPAVPAPAQTKERALPFTGEAETRGLDVSGSKTFGVDIGNRRDLRLRQSLDLRLSGKVGEDVTLLALLSDQDVPFQPEGSTAELDELDKVLVELRSPRAAVGLGDVEIAERGTRFVDLERRLEGLTAEATFGGTRTRGAYASAKGEFTSAEFFGEEGRQGPYRLADRAGQSGIVVVAGTESVWLDGTPLKRGAEEDYVIDYGLGEVTFTSRHPIRADSRIVVDYEVGNARYRRRLLFAGAEGLSLGGGGTLRATLVRESDDADNPFAGALSASERAALAALGDSAATVSGGTAYVGPGLGDYDLVADPESGREIFVFVDGAGDYRVSFVAVGEAQGDYAVDDELSTPTRAVYRFVGDGRGDFTVRRDLTAPESRSVADLRWDLAGSGGRLSVEGALSDGDRNTLSSRDDGDNTGSAVILEGRGATASLGRGWTATPEIRWRRVDDRFVSPGRIREGFYGRDWNLSPSGPVGGENLFEGAVETAWGDRLRWRADGGRLAAADTAVVYRQQQTATWRDRWVGATGTWVTAAENRDRGADGRLDQRTGEVRLVRWAVQPRLRLYDEDRVYAGAGNGERHREWETALRFPLPAGTLVAEAGLGRRRDDGRDSTAAAWSRIRDTDRYFIEASGNVSALAMLLRWEERRVETPEGAKDTRSLGRLDLRHDALRGAWSGLLTADLGTVGLRRRPKIIEPDSTGYFDEFGNYVGPGGGYDVRYEGLGEETLTSRLDLSSRLRWSPRGDERVGPLLRHTAWEGFVTLSEASTLPLGEPARLFSLSSYLNPDHTLDGALRLRQTVDLAPNARRLGGRLRYEENRRLTRNQATSEGSLVERSGDRALTATVRGNPDPAWNVEVEGTRGDRTSGVSLSATNAFELRTDLRSGTVRAGRRFGATAAGGRVSAEVTYSDEDGGDRKAAGWVVRPRAQWTFSNRGRIDVRYARTELVVRRGFPALRGPGAPSLTEGWRLDVIGDLRVREGIAVTATVVIDGPRGFDTVTEGRVDVRGTF